MAAPSTFRVKCPNCGAVGRGNETLLRRDVKCPNCHDVVRFVAATDQLTQPPADVAIPSPVPSPQYPPTAPPIIESRSRQSQPNEEPASSGQKPPRRATRTFFQFDTYQKISAWIAGGGLLILGLSPFFTWDRPGNNFSDVLKASGYGGVVPLG